jgi:hypothetical protein
MEFYHEADDFYGETDRKEAIILEDKDNLGNGMEFELDSLSNGVTEKRIADEEDLMFEGKEIKEKIEDESVNESQVGLNEDFRIEGKDFEEAQTGKCCDPVHDVETIETATSDQKVLTESDMVSSNCDKCASEDSCKDTESSLEHKEFDNQLTDEENKCDNATATGKQCLKMSF